MKHFTKMLLACTLMVSPTLRINADNTYPYLTFVTQQGETTVAVTSLQMAIAGSTLTVTHTGGTSTFNLTDLIKMYFSTSSTGISTTTVDEDEAVEVLTIGGLSLGKYTNKAEAIQQLKKGVYVLKSKSKTVKVAIQ